MFFWCIILIKHILDSSPHKKSLSSYTSPLPYYLAYILSPDHQSLSWVIRYPTSYFWLSSPRVFGRAVQTKLGRAMAMGPLRGNLPHAPCHWLLFSKCLHVLREACTCYIAIAERWFVEIAWNIILMPGAVQFHSISLSN